MSTRPIADTPELPTLLTMKDAALVLNVSARTLWTLTNTRQIPHLRLGRSVRFDPRDLSLWLDARKVRPHAS
jgi:excisionase family DNA binding protein